MKQFLDLDLNNVVFIDIETVPVVKELKLDTPLYDAWEYKKRRDGLSDVEVIESYSNEAGLHPEFAKIVCISVGRVSDDEIFVKSYSGHDEFILLGSFNEDLNLVIGSNKKTVFCGHAAIGFDIPFIFKRMIVNQIRPASLLDVGHLKPWEVTTVDTKDVWKANSFSPASLISICAALGIPSPKQDIDGSQVGELYWSGEENALERITTYCENDVIATANVVRRGRFEPLLTRGEVSGQEEIEELSLIERLNNGAPFGVKEKGELEAKVLDPTLTDTEREGMLDILEAVASNKGTKVTKAFVEKLRKKVDG